MHSEVCVSYNFSDDILETFLSEYHQKRHCGSKSATSATDLCDKGESEEEEEEECVMIPELPSGQELTIVILSTWGDKYYVGLSSIEVFTASGEMAAVEKVRGRRRKIHRVRIMSLLCPRSQPTQATSMFFQSILMTLVWCRIC